MKRLITFAFHISLFSFLFSLLNCAQAQALNIDTLAIQDFELSPQAPVWNFTGPVIYNSGFSSATAAPPNSPIGIGGSRAWETTTNSGGLILDFANIPIPPTYDSIRVHFNLASMNLNGSTGGPDNLDYVLVAYSLDGGTTYTNRLRIRGSAADNSFWAYSATGVAKVYYTPATETMFQPTTVGLQTTFGYSNCEIVFPGTVTQVAMRITGRSSSSSDTWLVDNLLITGENLCASTAATIAPTNCDSYTSPSGAYTWTTTGTYMDTIPNSTGCDSVITVNLTINNSTSHTITASTCDTAYTSPSGNYTWTASGTYQDTLPNALGCDSLITVNLTLLQSTAATLTDTACYTYTTPGGTVITTSGTYQDTIPNTAGCDSVLTINLTVLQPVAATTQSGNTLTATATGATYTWVDCNNAFAPIPGATGQSFTPTATGTYAVIVSEQGCADTSSCVSITIVGIANPGTASITLHPNPASHTLVLNAPADLLHQHFTVYDAQGRAIRKGTVAGAATIIDIAHLPRGMYTLHVEGMFGPSGKFIKH